MNSAMNRELVYLILIGINNFMEDNSFEGETSQDKFNTSSTRDKKKIILEKDESRTKIIFDEIRFTNIKELNVMTESDTVSVMTKEANEFLKQNQESIRIKESLR